MSLAADLQRLVEAFYGFYGRKGQEFEIDVNPTQDEMDKLVRKYQRDERFIRFIANYESQKVYVFSAMERSHSEVMYLLGIDPKQGDFVLLGEAERQGSKWTCIMSFDLEAGSIPDLYRFLSADWSWVDQYIMTTPYLEKLAKDIDAEDEVGWKQQDDTG